jgi:AraC-like DNA-binding protein
LELLHSQSLIPVNWSPIPYDQWADDLHSICGSFNPRTTERGRAVTGAARGIDVCGMQFAHVSNDLDRVHRDWEDIRRDSVEHLFLIVQLEGSCGVDHIGQQNTLDVGDCILVDSTKPTTFHFGGAFSNHLSMHLPRQIMYSESEPSSRSPASLQVSIRWRSCCRALIAKIMSTPETDTNSASLKQLMFNATRQAFVADPAISGLQSTARQRHAAAADGRHPDRPAPDRHESLSQVAGDTHRRFDQDIAAGFPRCRRDLHHHHPRQAAAPRQGKDRTDQGCQRGGKTIAEVAYSAGFNDISYFNRSFKELFDCAPTDLLKHSASKVY